MMINDILSAHENTEQRSETVQLDDHSISLIFDLLSIVLLGLIFKLISQSADFLMDLANFFLEFMKYQFDMSLSYGLAIDLGRVDRFEIPKTFEKLG